MTKNRYRPALAMLLAVALRCSAAHAGAIGVFETGSDIGPVLSPGSESFSAESGEYRITASGKDFWADTDEGRFVHRPATGDLKLSMDVRWTAASKANHRKACAMIRQSLDADSPYVDVAVHGDGLIGMQYRLTKGGTTLSAATPIKAPAGVKIERDGDIYTTSVLKDGVYQPIASVRVPLGDSALVGLAVSSHDAKTSETAIVSNVQLTSRPIDKDVKRVRETTLETLDIASGERHIVYREIGSFEAPNWSRDGKTFFINRSGDICTLPVEGGTPTKLQTGVVGKHNNDHGLSPDGKWLAISVVGNVKEGSKIYVLPSVGGQARQLTPVGPSYWHGWSPDGATMAFCGKRGEEMDIYTMPVAGGIETRLTTAPGLDDGCEFSPDGKKIYFNSERTGQMHIWRMNTDGTQQEQVTRDDASCDWFAHLAPDGRSMVYLSFDKTVKGHPIDQNVQLRSMPLDGDKPTATTKSKTIATLFGGQGTINVPSWSPDGKKLAFVSYRYVLP